MCATGRVRLGRIRRTEPCILRPAGRLEVVHSIVDTAREGTSDHVLSCCGCVRVWVGGVFACPPPPPVGIGNPRPRGPRLAAPWCGGFEMRPDSLPRCAAGAHSVTTCHAHVGLRAQTDFTYRAGIFCGRVLLVLSCMHGIDLEHSLAGRCGYGRTWDYFEGGWGGGWSREGGEWVLLWDKASRCCSLSRPSMLCYFFSINTRITINCTEERIELI